MQTPHIGNKSLAPTFQPTARSPLESDLVEVWIFEWDDGCLARELVFRTGECHSQELTRSDVDIISRLAPERVRFVSPEVRQMYMQQVHGIRTGFLKIAK
jgi:hypothetical protein